jgi:hypothetical protein
VNKTFLKCHIKRFDKEYADILKEDKAFAGEIAIPNILSWEFDVREHVGEPVLTIKGREFSGESLREAGLFRSKLFRKTNQIPVQTEVGGEQF